MLKRVPTPPPTAGEQAPAVSGSGERARGGAGVSRLRRLWTGCLVAILVLTAAPFATTAQEPWEQDSLSLGQTRYLAPMSELLSGPAWLVAEGLDPRLFGANYGVYAPADQMYGPAPAPPTGSGASNQLVPFRSAAPAFSRNMIITRQVGYAPYNTEPHIAVNPLDPDHLVVGTIDYNFGGAASYTSFDGGETWDGPNPVRYYREDLAAGGDPVVTFDRDGNVYLSQMSLGIQEFTVGSVRSGAVVSSIIVAKSVDGGLHWMEPAPAAITPVITSGSIQADGRGRGEVTIPFLDKEWIYAGPDPDDPSRDLIHVTYTEFRSRYRVIYADEVPFLTSILTESVIKSVTSRDSGMTWSQPIAVSPVVFFSEGAGPEGDNLPIQERQSPSEPQVGLINETPTPALDLSADEPNASEGADPGTPNRGGRTPATATPATGSGDPVPNRGAMQQGEDQPGTTASSRVVQGSQPFVLSDGTYGVAYHDTTEDGFLKGLATIMVAFSNDGGVTFGQPQQATVFKEVRGRPRAATFRLGGSGFPQVAVGPEDEIYIVHSRIPEDKPIDDGDIFFFASFDQGESWTDAVRLNGDDTTRPQFYPAIAAGEDGVLHAMWGDMRDDPDEIRYHIYYTRSEDQGETWGFVDQELGISEPDTRVSDFPTNSLRAFVGGRFIGDYFAIAANERDVYMVWADGRMGEYGGPGQQIGFARRRAIRPPELFLNPPSGPAGRDVTIQGFGFQPNSDIIITIGGVITGTLRTDSDGFFSTTLYTPVTGEGARDIAAFDETGNVARASFFTEFGFDTLQRSQQELTDQITDLQRQLDEVLVVPTVTPDDAVPSPPASGDARVSNASVIGGWAGFGAPSALLIALMAAYIGFTFGRRRIT